MTAPATSTVVGLSANTKRTAYSIGQYLREQLGMRVVTGRTSVVISRLQRSLLAASEDSLSRGMHFPAGAARTARSDSCASPDERDP